MRHRGAARLSACVSARPVVESCRGCEWPWTLLVRREVVAVGLTAAAGGAVAIFVSWRQAAGGGWLCYGQRRR